MMNNEQRPYLDEAWLYLEYVIKGRIQKDIAKPYNISHQRIGQLVKLFGLTEKRNALRKPYMNKEWLAREFVDKRRTRQSIADECGVNKCTIAIWRARHGLKRKSFTKEEITQRNVAGQNRRYATDPEYRKMKIENTLKWRKENYDRWLKYHRKYDRKRRKKEAMSE